MNIVRKTTYTLTLTEEDNVRQRGALTEALECDLSDDTREALHALLNLLVL